MRRIPVRVLAMGIAAVTLCMVAGAWALASDHLGAASLSSAFGPDLIVPIGISAVGAMVAARRSSNPIGWLLLFTGLVDGARGAIAEYAIHGLSSPGLPAVNWMAWASNWDLLLIFPAGSFLFIFLLFPNGRFLTRRWQIVAALAVVFTALGLVSTWFDPAPIVLLKGLKPAINPLGIAGFPLASSSGFGNAIWPVGMFLIGLAALSLTLRFRRAPHEQRVQIKWIALAVAFSVAAILTTVPFSLASPSTTGSASPLMNAAIILGMGVAIPVACGIAILKYRLYGIDVVISRALIYGSLAALISAVYVAIAVGIGDLVGSGGRPNLGLSILATAVVAVGFQPARARLQRVANRIVYGRRASPYEVLSQFSARVAETYAAEEVLPRMARVLREGTGADSATVWLRSGAELRPAATIPDHLNGFRPVPVVDEKLPAVAGADAAVPVFHQGELLGALTVVKRRGESLTPIEHKLLDDLAHQAGLVLKNVGLTTELLQRLEELRASRQRLVSAQDEERRRLERNLHDGAQQHLVALKVKLGLAEMLMEKDAGKAVLTLQQLKSDADEALETLRDLARGIYPPVLADHGLAAALEAQARKATLPVTLEAAGLARYPQAQEAAVYFSVLEALQNVQKYASASQAMVRVRDAGRRLSFEVVDDGRGFDVAHARKGSGLTNVNDRLNALGGQLEVESSCGMGCRLRGWLPIPESHAPPPPDFSPAAARPAARPPTP